MYPYHRDQKNRDGLVRDILVVHNKFLCDCVSSGQVAASDYFGCASPNAPAGPIAKNVHRTFF
ncbi:MAG: hypothetical protein APF83_12290 [Lutibacter sp. BRH_c52]|nr:MAG: hypothetical protein APF83_12290 [Lutibacter sp. BRH_c52]